MISLAFARIGAQTYCVTNRNMMASNAELAEALKTKLAAMPRVYTLVNESPTSTPNTLSAMKNMITMATHKSIRSSVRSASPTSRMERERKRRSLYILSSAVLISAREISPFESLSKTLNAASAEA